jgi:hypothetical protein
MHEESVTFHVEHNDYFGTLATVLDLLSQDLRKKGHLRNAETLVGLRDRLMYLQHGYRIEKIVPNSKIPGYPEVDLWETRINGRAACHRHRP